MLYSTVQYVQRERAPTARYCILYVQYSRVPRSMLRAPYAHSLTHSPHPRRRRGRLGKGKRKGKQKQAGKQASLDRRRRRSVVVWSARAALVRSVLHCAILILYVLYFILSCTVLCRFVLLYYCDYDCYIWTDSYRTGSVYIQHSKNSSIYKYHSEPTSGQRTARAGKYFSLWHEVHAFVRTVQHSIAQDNALGLAGLGIETLLLNPCIQTYQHTYVGYLSCILYCIYSTVQYVYI